MVLVVCCICHEDLFRKSAKAEDGCSSQEAKSKSQETLIVTTKCGHLFHSNCLKSWFQKKGAEVWTTRDCPVCQMTLTVATDLIRLFPTLEDDTGQTVEDLKARIEKLENANGTLSSHLETAFLRGREQEKKLQMKMKQNEQLQQAFILEKTKGNQFETEAVSLKRENEELRNVIITLNRTFAKGGGNTTNTTTAPFGPYSEQRVGGQPGFQGNQYAGKQAYQQPTFPPGRSQQQHHQPKSGWVPSKPVANNVPNHLSSIDLREGFASLSLNAKSQMDDFPALSSSTGGETLSNGSAILKSVGGDTRKDDGNSEGDFRRSAEPSPPNRAHSSSSSSGKSTNSFIAEANLELRKLLPAHPDFPDLNGNNPTTPIVMDETPTDELMDAILKSKPKSTGRPKNSLESNKYSGGTDAKRTGYRKDDSHFMSQKKIYGKFCCENCEAKWGTSRHVYNQPQTCLNCKETVYPYAQEPVKTKEELAQDKLNRKRNT